MAQIIRLTSPLKLVQKYCTFNISNVSEIVTGSKLSSQVGASHRLE